MIFQRNVRIPNREIFRQNGHGLDLAHRLFEMKDDHTCRQSNSRIETRCRDDGAFEYEHVPIWKTLNLSNQKKLLVPICVSFCGCKG